MRESCQVGRNACARTHARTHVRRKHAHLVLVHVVSAAAASARACLGAHGRGVRVQRIQHCCTRLGVHIYRGGSEGCEADPVVRNR